MVEAGQLIGRSATPATRSARTCTSRSGSTAVRGPDRLPQGQGRRRPGQDRPVHASSSSPATASRSARGAARSTSPARRSRPVPAPARRTPRPRDPADAVALVVDPVAGCQRRHVRPSARWPSPASAGVDAEPLRQFGRLRRPPDEARLPRRRARHRDHRPRRPGPARVRGLACAPTAPGRPAAPPGSATAGCTAAGPTPSGSPPGEMYSRCRARVMPT